MSEKIKCIKPYPLLSCAWLMCGLKASVTAVSLKKILLDRIFCWKALSESSNAAKLLFELVLG